MKLFKLSAFSILFLLMVCTNAMVVSGTGMGLYSSTEVPRMADVNSPSVTGAKLDNRSPTPEQATTQKPRRGGGLKRSVSYSSMPISGEGKVYEPMVGSKPQSSLSKGDGLAAQDRSMDDKSLASHSLHKSDSKLTLREAR
ncbi:hypothetical protein GUITHDRAFT_153895 [Guillardia theta CCMP2712]|uniref:Uncharacterized protein n=2 Tax=Guillardia theta TaxID=55529 RepID=L1IY90_GUITC|nr:hypothetical protein GUITHDRAFT_153895 [Guillardia theta CCMP2712]EKX41243.1 hypothetical protein GUITHDRAFT_153895 [Guillardia theta CCMP2712]|eukprot:XP_005828223.1 hypothetical protein GUITHDRAFT_153895 [Guillardia theta CCMP2712]